RWAARRASSSRRRRTPAGQDGRPPDAAASTAWPRPWGLEPRAVPVRARRLSGRPLVCRRGRAFDCALGQSPPFTPRCQLWPGGPGRTALLRAQKSPDRLVEERAIVRVAAGAGRMTPQRRDRDEGHARDELRLEAG